MVVAEKLNLYNSLIRRLNKAARRERYTANTHGGWGPEYHNGRAAAFEQVSEWVAKVRKKQDE